MKHIRHLSIVAAIFFALILIVLVVPARVQVTIENRSNVQLQNIKLSFNGGDLTIPTLASGASYAGTVRSKGESAAVIQYDDASHIKHVHELDIYVEPQSSGTLHIVIGANGKVTSQLSGQ